MKKHLFLTGIFLTILGLSLPAHAVWPFTTSPEAKARKEAKNITYEAKKDAETIKKEADEYKKQIRKEAETIKEKAKLDAEQIKKEAQSSTSNTTTTKRWWNK